MTDPTSPARRFRDRFRAGDVLMGSFLKIAHTMPTEILGVVGYDFIIADEEHAPLDRAATDAMVLACRAWGMAALVRVREPGAAAILSALDSGAEGVLVPHVDSPETAARIVAHARYGGGHRGYSPTTRAGRFGSVKFADHMQAQDAGTTVIAMIEDVAALSCLDAILAVEGLDGVFIGRGDLTAALGAPSPQAPVVQQAVAAITAAARAAGKPICVMGMDPQDITAMHAQGARAFVLSSDQGFLKQGAALTLAAARKTMETGGS